ncbi:MAG: hypothetical protein R2831_01245 [Chitinophagaceae bacterium]
MKKIIYLLFLYIVSIGSAHADNNMMFEKANQMYRNNDFDSACNLYRQLINDGYTSPVVYYNCGNSFYKKNQIGYAIWCYEKAIQLQSKIDYKDNLFLAQKKIKEPIPTIEDIFFIRWWKSLYSLFSINSWAILGLLAFIATLLFSFLKKIKQQQFKTNLSPLFFTISVFAMCMVGVNYYQQHFNLKGIIIKPHTPFFPLSKTSSRHEIQDGIKVTFKQKTNKGILIKLPNGELGKIAPDAFKAL